MSLRLKLLVIFVVVALVPMLLIGALNHAATERALESMLAARAAEIADRVAGEIAGRRARQLSDLGLLAENAETRRLLAAANAAGGGVVAVPAGTEEYLRAAWRIFESDYGAIEILAANGAPLVRLGGGAAPAPPGLGLTGGPLRFDHPVVDAGTGARAGTVRAWVRREALLPAEALESRFGRGGSTVVADRASGQVLYAPPGREPPPLPADAGGAERGSFRDERADSPRVAAWVALDDPPWTVVSSASVAEFAAPFTRTQRDGLLLLLATVAAAFAASVVLVGRATRSLRELTLAAEEVGRGHFDPALPPERGDEVGRLSRAFGLMVGKLRDMMARVEASREMAVLGEFAAQLSHEIRNPLTSLKLNLQGLERDAAAGRLPADAGRPVEICLREIERLDRVVRNVLRLGGRDGAPRGPVAPDELVAEATELVRARAARQGVDLRVELAAGDATLVADGAALKGALLNVLLNGLEAMPEGGALTVRSEVDPPAADAARRVRISVADTGPGVPADLRDRIFRPYFTTRREGTGLGLAMALQAVQEHGGELRLDTPDGGAGATFVLELPVTDPAREAQPA